MVIPVAVLSVGRGVGFFMIYYVCYDSYGNPIKAVSAEELKRCYKNDTRVFLETVRGNPPETAHMTAHVATVNFRTKGELEEYLESVGESNKGFFEGEGDSRPYNF